jgi:hypothetical protein
MAILLLLLTTLPHMCCCCCMQIHEDHGRMRCLCRQYCMAGNTTHQKQLLALDIIRHSSMHSKKEDMVRAAVWPAVGKACADDVFTPLHLCLAPVGAD